MAKEITADMTGVILVGGKSRRMGQDKAFLELDGTPLFERVLAALRENLERIVLVGDRPERFTRYRLPTYPDIYPDSAMGGLYTGLFQAETPYIFAAACDFPFPSGRVARHLISLADDFDAVVPQTPHGFEPLFAVYGKRCLGPMQARLERGDVRIYDLYPEIRVRYVTAEELSPFDDGGKALINVNTPEEFTRAVEKERS